MQEKYEQWLKLGEELANETTFHPGKRAFIKNVIATLRHADKAAKAQETIPKDITELPEEPRYDNDCPHCVFLGHFDAPDDPKKYDLYFCRLSPSVVARWTSKEAPYLSALNTPHEFKPLLEAQHRAQQKGLITSP